MIFHQNFEIIFLTLVTTVCSKCYHFRQYDYSFGHEGREIINLYCVYVTSEVLLKYDGQAEVEVISIEKSRISLIPSNSSLSRFVSVRRLDMSELGIEEIAPGAFSGLKNLLVLILANNNITTVHSGVFDELLSLEELDLSDNQISVLEENCFVGLTNLRSLKLSYNRLTVTNAETFKGLTSLTMLNISENQLTEIHNYDLPALREIYANRNKITKLTADWSQTNLTIISLDECLLSEVDFALFPKNLSTLTLQFNQIKLLLNFDKLSSKFVGLSHNELTRIEIYPQHVSYLFLAYNKIKTLKNSQSGENSDIYGLILFHNEIVEINSESFLGLNNLEDLDLQHNPIKSLNREAFKSLKNLMELKIEGIDFEHVDPNTFADLPNLEILGISRATYYSLNSSSISSKTKVYSFKEDKRLN